MKRIFFCLLLTSLISANSFAEEKKSFIERLFNMENSSAKAQSTLRAASVADETTSVKKIEQFLNGPIIDSPQLQIIKQTIPDAAVTDICVPTCINYEGNGCVFNGRIWDDKVSLTSLYYNVANPVPIPGDPPTKTSQFDVKCVFNVSVMSCYNEGRMHNIKLFASSEIVCDKLSTYSFNKQTVTFDGVSDNRSRSTIHIENAYYRDSVVGFKVDFMDMR